MTIDGQTTQQSGGTRFFITPPLKPDKTYTIRAEWNRDSRFVNAKKKVEVRAGQPSEVSVKYQNSGPSEEKLDAPTSNK